MRTGWLVACAGAVLALAACQREAGSPRQDQAAEEAATPQQGEVPVLRDVMETDARYIVGISYPPEANRYPGLAVELHRYADAARAALMDAVEGAPADSNAGPYDLSLVFTTVADTPQVFAIAADGSSYTGGAHAQPLVARFVWLPGPNRLLQVRDLFRGEDAWRELSIHAREQLHTALSQRIDADGLDQAERERVMRSAARMIDAGTEPDPDNFTNFEPVVGADGRIRALRFVFPPYQVGPYSDGVQTVEIPARALLPHVAEEYRALFSGG